MSAISGPGAGGWIRGEEHETALMLRHPKLGYTISIGYRWCDGDELKRWLVETLKMWPHPDAPRTDDEYNDPEYRQQKYAKLMGLDDKNSAAVEWTVIFNSDLDVWGAYSYNEKNDVLRATATVKKAEGVHEYFTIEFVKGADNEAIMQLVWDTTLVELPIGLK